MDCASTDVEDTGSDSVEDTDVDLDSGDDSSAASGSGTDSYDDTSWDEDSGDSGGSDDCGDSDTPDVAASTGSVDDGSGSGDHCAPAAAHPSLGDPSMSDPSVPEQVASTAPSTAVAPAAASAGAPLVSLPDHVGVPGETIGSPDGARIVTPGVFTPTPFDAAGNATHVSYSGIIAPPTESVTMGGNQTMPASTHPQVLATQALINQTNADMITHTLTGVSVDRSGSSPTYYGAGKPFDDFGDALGNERHPEP